MDLTRRAVVRSATAAGAVAAMAVLGVVPVSADTGDRVWTTGLNSDGQLGNGTTTNRGGVAAVAGLSDVSQVAGGREHALALAGGQVYAWGDGSKGATGQGNLVDRSTPGVVSGVVPAGQSSTVVAITTAHYGSYALLSDGTVRAWGYNATGQLGDGTSVNRTTPVTVKGLSGVTQVSAGRDMAMALMADGTVRTWGQGTNGELGNGTTTARQTTPVTVPGLTGVRALAGGRNHVLALMSDGTVMAWGQNTYGQVGNGVTSTRQTTAVPVAGVRNAVAVEAGAEFSVALLSDGRVMTWGRNNNGQLASGTAIASRATADYVSGLSGTTVTAIGCGRDHAFAVGSNGQVHGQLFGWGLDNYGQLGDRAGSTRRAATAIAGVTGVKEVHAGYGYSILRRAS